MSVGLTLALPAPPPASGTPPWQPAPPPRPKPDLAPSSVLTEFNKNENGFYLPFRVT